MSKSDRIEFYMRHNVVQDPSKINGRLTNENTLKNYARHISNFCEWARNELGLKRMGDLPKNGYTPQKLIQEYQYMLAARNLRATSVHTILAPVCKGLMVSMSEIKMEPRLAKDIKRNPKRSQNAAGAKQMEDPSNARIVQLAKISGLRPRALVRLTIDNLIVDEYGDHLLVIRDKGGKVSMQLLFPHEVEVVRRLLTTDKDGKPLPPGQKPFSPKDIKQMALTKFRYERAQLVLDHFDRLFNAWISMPRETPAQQQAREEARIAAEAAKKEWIEKLVSKYRKHHPKSPEGTIAAFREQLEKPSEIVICGGNRERAVELGRPIAYDRVAVKIASIYTLSHWSDESTLRNYLTK